MADYKISELPEQTSIEDDDLVVIADEATGSYTSKKSKMSSVKSYMGVAKCRVTLSGDQNIDNTTITKVEFDTEDYDVDSEFDTTNHEFTAGSTGKYLVSVSGAIDDLLDTDIFDLYIEVDTGGGYSLVRMFRTKGVSNNVVVFTAGAAIVSLSSGDKLALYCYQDEGNQQVLQSTTNRTWMEIAKLS